MSSRCDCCSEGRFVKNAFDETLCRNCTHQDEVHRGPVNSPDLPSSNRTVSSSPQAPGRPTPKPRARPPSSTSFLLQPTFPMRSNNRVLTKKAELEALYRERVSCPPNGVQLAREILEMDSPPSSRYSKFDLGRLLDDNKPSATSDSHDNLPMIISAFDILEKYAVNLLKPNRPQFWRQIKFSNGVFQARVNCLKGSRDLLKAMGYSEEFPNGLAFPQHVEQPDVDVVAQVAVELLLARIEVESLHDGSHPNPDSLNEPLLHSTSLIPFCDMSPAGGSEATPRPFTSEMPPRKFKPVPTPRKRLPSGSPSVGGSVQGHTVSRPFDSTLLKQKQEQQEPGSSLSSDSLYSSCSDVPAFTQTLPLGQQSGERPSSSMSGSSNISSSSAKMCPSCNLEGPPVAKFCFSCGALYPELESKELTCGKCQTKYDKGSKFCKECGSLLKQEVKPVKEFKCSQCNKKCGVDCKFCPDCGGKVISFDVATPSLVEAGSPLPYQTKSAAKSPSPPAKRKVEVEPESNKWNCEFCTFINDEDSRVCGMCYKTRTMPLQPVKKAGKGKEKQVVKESESVKTEEPAKEETLTQISRQPSQQELNESQMKLRQYSSSHNENVAVAGALSPVSPVDSEESFTKSQKAQSAKLGQLMRKQKQRSEESGSIDEESGSSFQRGEERGKAPVVIQLSAEDPRYGFGNAGRTIHSTIGSYVSEGKLKADAKEEWQRRQREDEERAKQLAALQEEREKREQKERIRSADKQFFQFLKMGETLGYSPEEVEVGLKNSRDPILWLNENWSGTISSVAELAAKESKKSGTNLGPFSYTEARNELLQCGGDCVLAANSLLETREKQVKAVIEEGDFDIPSICHALMESDGDTSLAVTSLQQEILEPFLNRIWTQEGFSSDDEKRDDIEFRQQKIPLKVQELLEDRNVHIERRIRVAHAEYKMESYGRAYTVIRLLDCEQRGNEQGEGAFDVQQAVKAANDLGVFDAALAHLQMECNLCYQVYPADKFLTMTICQHSACRFCIVNYFENAIKEKTVPYMKCPFCDKPNLENNEEVDFYFQMLNGMIHKFISQETYELLQKKVNERAICRDPTFRWCPHCKSGHLNEGQVKKIRCPDCNKESCFDCKEKWLPAHDDATCENFHMWLIENDPDNQQAGLAAHLNQNGIDCPECNMRFALSKGGCMHFKCSQCSYEFCSGCSGHYSKTCRKFDGCAARGFHAHHPRDCLFFLRDNSVHELQFLLRHLNVDFDVEVQKGQKDAARAQAELGEEELVQLKCHVMEQKETPDGLADEACNKDVDEGFAGLCENHYKEYLVHLINKNTVDSVFILDTGKIEALLRRELIVMPPKGKGETDDDYLERLREYVQEKSPLKKRDNRGVLHWDN